MTADVQYFEPWQTDVVLFIERVHSVTGAVPKDADILEYIRFTKKNPDFPVAKLSEFKEDPRFLTSMESRGIPVAENILTAEQMAAASVMLNLTDRRSDEKKLRDLGISTEQFSNWMQNSVFAEYMRQRSEVLITNSTHEAHMGLMRGVRSGNTASIKLYYEMTGRYNPEADNQVNLRVFIMRVLEAIQKHVRDPTVLNALSIELSQLSLDAANPNSPSVANTIKGELQ